MRRKPQPEPTRWTDRCDRLEDITTCLRPAPRRNRPLDVLRSGDAGACQPLVEAAWLLLLLLLFDRRTRTAELAPHVLHAAAVGRDQNVRDGAPVEERFDDVADVADGLAVLLPR